MQCVDHQPNQHRGVGVGGPVEGVGVDEIVLIGVINQRAEDMEKGVRWQQLSLVGAQHVGDALAVGGRRGFSIEARRAQLFGIDAQGHDPHAGHSGAFGSVERHLMAALRQPTRQVGQQRLRPAQIRRRDG